MAGNYAVTYIVQWKKGVLYGIITNGRTEDQNGGQEKREFFENTCGCFGYIVSGNSTYCLWMRVDGALQRIDNCVAG